MKDRKVTNTLLTYFFMLATFICVRILFLKISLPFSENVSDIITTLFVQGVIMFGLPVFLFSRLQKQKVSSTFHEFGYTKLKFAPIALCFLIGFMCYFLNTFIASFFNTIITLFGFENMPTNNATSTTDYSIIAFVIQILTVAILPAICEETAHRGMLLKGLSPFGIVRALILSSLMFGLMHLSVQQFFYTTILGFIIGLSVVVSKSIWPGIIIHFMNNFLSVYFTFAKGNGWFGYQVTDILTNFLYSGGSVISFFVTTILVLGAMLLALVSLFVSLLKQTRIKSVQNMLIDISNINSEVENGSTNDKGLISLYQVNKLMQEYNINSFSNMVFVPSESKKRKATAFEKICLASILIMGGFVTISTFVWGIV